MDKKLTVKEAIEQGYEYYIYPDEGYQVLKSLDDGDIEFDKNPVVVEKEPIEFGGIDKDQIKEALADIVWENWYELTSDDTDAVHDLFEEIDFSGIEKVIQEKIKELTYFKGSEIQLIFNP